MNNQILYAIKSLEKKVVDLYSKIKNINVSSAGNLQAVTDQGNETTNDIELIDEAKILFDNGSRLKKGTTNSYTGGNGGIAQVCSINYELKWEAGRLYTMQQDGFTIREVSHNFTLTPGVNDDITRGFVSDSRWILDNGNIYICTDNTEGAAVWELQVSVVPGLQDVTDIGANTTNPIKIGTGSNYTGQYNLFSSNGYENWFNGGFNWSAPTHLQIKREQISNSNIYSLLSVQTHSISLSVADANHYSNISAFATELVLSSFNVNEGVANEGSELRVFSNRIQFSKTTETYNKRINLLIDNTTFDGDYYFPANPGTLALTSDISNRPYKVYTALLLQTGTSAPTAVVLENTIGNIVWSYNNVGDYRATLANAFPSNKTTITVNNATFPLELVKGGRINSNTLVVYTTNRFGDGFLGNDALNGDSVCEIRVYN